jgi:hypothetical protein
LGERLCRTPEEFKAWSQSLGHEQVLTTFSSYGEVTHQRRAELITTEPDARDGEAIERSVRILQNARQRVH